MFSNKTKVLSEHTKVSNCASHYSRCYWSMQF